MSNRSLQLLIVAAILLLGGVFYYLYESAQSKYDWEEVSWNKKSYRQKSEEPYGTHIAYRLLEHYFPGKSLVKITENVGDELPQDSLSGRSYVFIGEALYMDSLSTERLLEFVAAGNTALISSKSIPFDLMFHLYYEQCEETGWDDYAIFNDTVARMGLVEPTLQQRPVFQYARQNQPQNYAWHYIPTRFFCAQQPQRPLGYVNDSVVGFAEFPYGQGRFLLHTNPIVFSNFSLLRPENHPYVEGIWSQLPVGDIWWDDLSQVPEAVSRRRNRGTRGGLDDDHPLTFILQQPALAWAWYLLAGLAGAWLFFRAKRRQRIIPVLPKNENSSYEFIGTIANLHFRERDFQTQSIQQMKLFLAQLRERYGVVAPLDAANWLPRTDDEFFRRLAKLSEVPETQLRLIFAKYADGIQFQATEQTMVDLHLAMEGFFRRAK
ncbi:MAG: DUF4350 domain-containing protein [Saprospiraceae bacterium]